MNVLEMILRFGLSGRLSKTRTVEILGTQQWLQHFRRLDTSTKNSTEAQPRMYEFRLKYSREGIFRVCFDIILLSTEFQTEPLGTNCYFI